MSEGTNAQPNAVITGASSGIGEAFAHLLAAEGYRPVLIARSRPQLERVAEAIRGAFQVQPAVMPKDLSARDAAAEIEDELANREIFPDILVNNAGFGLMGSADELALENQTEMIDLNVRTLTELSLRCSRIMRRKGRGGIINVSSVAGTLPGPNMAIYYATKAYILSFTEALEHELKPLGIKVTALVPGVTRTDFHRRAGMEGSLLLKFCAPMSAEAVARIGFRGFQKGRRLVVPGLPNKFAMFCTRLVPHFILLPVTAKLHTLKSKD